MAVASRALGGLCNPNVSLVRYRRVQAGLQLKTSEVMLRLLT